MKRNLMASALVAMLGAGIGAALPAKVSEGAAPLMGPAKVSAGRPPRRAGHGVRAARRAAAKVRNVARNRRAHR